MDRNKIKDIWFYSNVCLFVNYSLRILRIFVVLPLPVLPAFFNSLFLLVAYVLTFEALFSHFPVTGAAVFLKKAFAHPNAYCILLFLCFVPNTLLLPFYLLSIYHIVTFISSKKERFGSSAVYQWCVSLRCCISSLGRLSLFLQIVLFPVAFLMLLLGWIGFPALLAYGIMLRQQYVLNEHMRSVMGEVLQYANKMAMKLPDWLRMEYFDFVNSVRKYFQGKKEIKKE